MTISAVAGQQTGSTVDSSATATQAFTSNVTATNCIVVLGSRAIGANTAFVAGDCTKSSGTATLGTIALASQASFDLSGGSGDWRQVAIWVAKVTGSGSLTMAVSMGTGAFSVIAVGEFSSTVGWSDSPSVEAAQTGSDATNAVTSFATASMTSAGAALFLGMADSDGSTNIGWGVGTSWTSIYAENSPAHDTGFGEYRIVSSGTTTTANGTMSTDNLGYVVAGAVIKETAAADTLMGQILT